MANINYLDNTNYNDKVYLPEIKDIPCEMLKRIPDEIITRLFIESRQVGLISKQWNKLFSASVTWCFAEGNKQTMTSLVHEMYQKNHAFSKFFKEEDRLFLRKIFEQDPNSFHQEILNTSDNAALKILLNIPTYDPTQENNVALQLAIQKRNCQGLSLLLNSDRFDLSLNDYEVLFMLFREFNSENLEILNEMGRLLLQHPDMDPTARQNYAYIYAAYLGWMDMIKMLEQHPVNPGDQNNAAIWNAAEEGHAEVVEHLLALVDPSFPDNEALVRACTKNKAAVVQLLVQDQRVNPNEPLAISSAIMNGNYEVIEMLSQDVRFDLYATPAFTDVYSLIIDEERTVKHLAQAIEKENDQQEKEKLQQDCEGTLIRLENHKRIFQLFLSHPQFNPNKALRLACENNSHQLLPLLFVDSRLTENNIEKHFRMALKDGLSTKVVQAFLKYSPLPTYLRKNALDLVCVTNPTAQHAEIATLLIKDPEVNLTFGDQFVLQWAVFHNFDNLVEKLLKTKLFNLRVENHYCLRTALKNRNEEMINRIINTKSYKFTNSEIIDIFKSITPTQLPEKNPALGYLCVETPTKMHARIAAALVEDPEVDLLFQEQLLLKWSVYHGFTKLTEKLIKTNLFNLRPDDDYYLKTAIAFKHKKIAALLLSNSKFSYEESDLSKFATTPNKPVKKLTSFKEI